MSNKCKLLVYMSTSAVGRNFQPPPALNDLAINKVTGLQCYVVKFFAYVA